MLRRNVLIFHQAALGDFIITWPLAMALSRIFPQSRIIYVTHAQKGALAERVLGVESADAEMGWHLLHVPPPEIPRLPEKPTKLLEGAHTVISFTAGKVDSLSQGIARVRHDAKIVSLDTKHDVGGHVTESLKDQLHDWPALAEATTQMLRSVANHGVGFSRRPENRILIHPGAGSAAKQWPIERVVELLDSLKTNGISVRVLLGEAEIEKWPEATVRRIASIAEIRRPTTLLDLLDELSTAQAFVGNDSGPGHLAAMIGLPTLCLRGPSSSDRWCPLGPRVQVLKSEDLSTLGAQEVYTKLTNLAGG